MPYIDNLLQLFSSLCHLYIEKASFLGEFKRTQQFVNWEVWNLFCNFYEQLIWCFCESFDFSYEASCHDMFIFKKGTSWESTYSGIQQSRPSHPLQKEIAVFSIESVNRSPRRQVGEECMWGFSCMFWFDVSVYPHTPIVNTRWGGQIPCCALFVS